MSRETAYDYLKAQLELPDYFGRNLDALRDSLTDLPETRLIIKSPHYILTGMGEYGARLLNVLHDAAEESGRLEIKYKL